MMNPQDYYHFVTGRPPTARTPQTDQNMRFFLKHQQKKTEEEVAQFMNQIPANNMHDHERPWGSMFMTPDGLIPGASAPAPAPAPAREVRRSQRIASKPRRQLVFLHTMFGR
jgi:hypothetical protein